MLIYECRWSIHIHTHTHSISKCTYVLVTSGVTQWNVCVYHLDVLTVSYNSQINHINCFKSMLHYISMIIRKKIQCNNIFISKCSPMHMFIDSTKRYKTTIKILNVLWVGVIITKCGTNAIIVTYDWLNDPTVTRAKTQFTKFHYFFYFKTYIALNI